MMIDLSGVVRETAGENLKEIVGTLEKVAPGVAIMSPAPIASPLN